MATETLTTITMPKLGESVVEGTIGAWLKGVGDEIDKYDALVEVETDKASAELPAPVSGVLAEILVEPGSVVPVGAELCRIREAGAGPAPVAEADLATSEVSPRSNGMTPTVPPVTTRNGEIPDEVTLLRTRSSPVVRRLAEEHGIQISDVMGTGTEGRVTKRDILEHIARLEQAPSEERAAPRAAIEPARPEPRAAIELQAGDEVIPVTPMRRSIAEHMVRSERTAPHATVVMEVDMSRAVAYREARKDEFKRREGVDLTYLPLVIKAVTQALRDHPRLNAVWDEDRIIHRAAVNIGVAVGLEDGLVVPVVKNADRLSIAGLVHAVAEMAGKAKAGSLTPDDISGGTFTVNNPGTFGSLVSTPILVQPQVAILSTEAIIKRPVVVDDMIAIRSMMNLSLSIDHRALDGLAATRFLQQVKRWLESIPDDLSLY
jgi:2-oxoisovalerate dehydrogenase E2 component (dihydrolipoyl transacylase)